MMVSPQYRPSVVLVDDHPQVLKALSRLLAPSCEVVAGVESGEQGIEAAIRLKPDVMVVDFMMPEMDGLEVCRRVKKLSPETDVIILTALADERVEENAFQAGSSAFMPKHAASGALLSTIQRLMEKKRNRA